MPINGNLRRYESILKMLIHEGPISRAAIAQRLKMSLPNVSIYITELSSRGVVVDTGQEESSGGRPTTLIDLNRSSFYSIGVYLDISMIRCALVNFQMDIVKEIEHPITPKHNKDRIIKDLIDCVSKLVHAKPDLAKRIHGIGIAVAGLVDQQSGISLNLSKSKDWQDVPLVEILHKEFGYPVYIDNGVNAEILAEKMFGSGKNVKNFLLLHVGSGVGLGIVVQGELYRGAQGFAGEVGHTTVVDDGPLCFCGNHGCLERYVSAPSVIQEIARASAYDMDTANEPQSVSLQAIFDLAKKGDRLAISVLEKAGERLGVSLANLANIFNPELVVLGGRLIHLDDSQIFFSSAQKEIRSHAVAHILKNLRFEISKLKDSGGWMGGNCLVIDHTPIENLFKTARS